MWKVYLRDNDPVLVRALYYEMNGDHLIEFYTETDDPDSIVAAFPVMSVIAIYRVPEE